MLQKFITSKSVQKSIALLYPNVTKSRPTTEWLENGYSIRKHIYIFILFIYYFTDIAKFSLKYSLLQTGKFYA